MLQTLDVTAYSKLVSLMSRIPAFSASLLRANFLRKRNHSWTAFDCQYLHQISGL